MIRSHVKNTGQDGPVWWKARSKVVTWGCFFSPYYSTRNMKILSGMMKCSLTYNTLFFLLLFQTFCLTFSFHYLPVFSPLFLFSLLYLLILFFLLIVFLLLLLCFITHPPAEITRPPNPDHDAFLFPLRPLTRKSQANLSHINPFPLPSSSSSLHLISLPPPLQA